MFIIVFVTSMLLVLVNANQQLPRKPEQQCRDLKPQVHVDINKLLDRWFAVEIIFHVKEDTDLIKYHDVCPTIYLSKINPIQNQPPKADFHHWNTRHVTTESPEEQINIDEILRPLVKVWKDINNEETRTVKKDGRRISVTSSEELEQLKNSTLQRLRLLWNERGTRIEYSLRYNSSQPGFWMSFGAQNGSLTEKAGYTQFIGTIQLLKAVRDHLVITFCHISVDNQFFTLVLSQEPDMSPQELTGIHDFIINRKHLPITHIRKMCVLSSGTIVSKTIIYFFPSLLLSLLWLRQSIITYS